jgi:hypothetical protein
MFRIVSALKRTISGDSGRHATALFFAHYQDTPSFVFINCPVVPVASAAARANEHSDDASTTLMFKLVLKAVIGVAGSIHGREPMS